MLTAVLIKKMILDMYLCKFAFTSIKSDDYCAVSFESKKKKIPDLSLPPCICISWREGGGGALTYLLVER
jgi:hypothetical protein